MTTKRKLKARLEYICNDVTTFLNNSLSPIFTSRELVKIKGDYNRYLLKLLLGIRKELHVCTHHKHTMMLFKSKKEMQWTDPSRFGLVLNSPVFHYEICTSSRKPDHLQRLYDESIAELDVAS